MMSTKVKYTIYDPQGEEVGFVIQENMQDDFDMGSMLLNKSTEQDNTCFDGNMEGFNGKPIC